MGNRREVEHLEQFNKFYEKGDYMDELMMDREIEIIKQYPTEGKSAIEIGCGSGSCTERLRDIFDDIEVVEPSESNIALLKKKLPDVTCHQGLLEDFLPERTFDFVFFLNVIEHVEDPIDSLRYISRLVKHEGLIFISCPNCMSLNRRAGYKMGILKDYEQMAPKDIEVGHRRLYTVDMLNDHCDKAGLKVLAMKGMYLKPLSESQMKELDNINPGSVRAFYQLGEDVPQYCASLMAVATRKYY